MITYISALLHLFVKESLALDLQWLITLYCHISPSTRQHEVSDPGRIEAEIKSERIGSKRDPKDWENNTPQWSRNVCGYIHAMVLQKQIAKLSHAAGRLAWFYTRAQTFGSVKLSKRALNHQCTNQRSQTPYAVACKPIVLDETPWHNWRKRTPGSVKPPMILGGMIVKVLLSSSGSSLGILVRLRGEGASPNAISRASAPSTNCWANVHVNWPP